MSLTADDIIRILKAAKDIGLIEGEKTAAIPEKVPDEILRPFSSFDEPSDEEVLYWSTPYYDVLMAERAARGEALLKEREIKNG